MILKNKKIAIIGASSDISKYGYIISKNLIEKEYEVYLVNPKRKEILGKEVYPNLKSINKKIDLVIFVVPPKITLEILKQVKELKITEVWMQPGSESIQAINFCKENNIDCTHNLCIMMK